MGFDFLVPFLSAFFKKIGEKSPTMSYIVDKWKWITSLLMIKLAHTTFALDALL